VRVSLIVAAAAHGVIGANGGLPWHLPADLKRFKALTMGHHLLLGRKTWESIGRPLPGRPMLVLSRAPGLALPPEARQVATVAEGLEVARAAGERELFGIGGAEVYAQLLPLAERVYWTEVLAEVGGDTVFPPWDRGGWRVVDREDHPADARHAHPFRFETWERLSRS
jgi:dihydrofolate reductase